MRVFLCVLIVLLIAVNVYSFRLRRPPTLSLPLDRGQISQLNQTLSDIWNLTNGEFNFDTVTTEKSNAQNGDIWFLQTGSVVRIQYKANNTLFVITPDGY